MEQTVFLSEGIFADSEGKAPSEFRILRAGENGTRKGPLVFDKKAATSVLSEFSKGGVDLAIDYEHAMADPESRPLDRAAAGWFVPEIRNGELWATAVQWTPNGRAAVENKEFRYTSLWGDVVPDAKQKGVLRLTRLRNVALTNTPATLGTSPLVLSDGAEEETIMAEKEAAFVVALGARDEAEAIQKATKAQAILSDVSSVLEVSDGEAIRGAVRALKLKADKADKLEAQLAELELAQQKRTRATLIAKLTESGQLPPALHGWAEEISLSALEAFGKSAPALVEKANAKHVALSGAGNGATLTLTDEEKQAARKLGVKFDALLAEKARLAAAEEV